jgi:carbonic anhydrase/acetyltransferase-like protein (isoleucine patch superfamily)
MGLNQFAATKAVATDGSLELAPSAALLGEVRVGPGCIVAQGAVIRSVGSSVQIGAHSALLENAVVIGRPELPTYVGRKVVFGHRCLVVGAMVGDLCEIGNSAVLLAGARLGNRCFVGEGALIPEGMAIPDDMVLVGRPARVLRRAERADFERLARLRGFDLSLSMEPMTTVSGAEAAGAEMGKLFAYQDKHPSVACSAILFDSAEVTGDVIIGEETIIGAGVKIIGDSHGPVRIGARVQILENTVLHLLPDNALIIEDDVVIGPGAMIHGCHIRAGSVVEPGAIVCDSSYIGRNCRVKAGSLVKQRAVFEDGAVIEGFPGVQVETLPRPQPLPAWALRREDLASLTRRT